MKLHLPKGLRLAVLSCSTGVAVACSTAQAAENNITTNTAWNNNDDHAGDTTTVSGATLTINSSPVSVAGTTYDYGTITVENSGTLELNTWPGGASDKRDVTTSVGATNPTRPIIASNITLDDSTLLFNEGAYEFSGTVTIAGSSTIENVWSKGHVINKLVSSGENAQLTYKCRDTGYENSSPLTILNEGAFSGRVVMDNQDSSDVRISYLVLKNANALGNGTTIVDLGSGAYDTRNHLSADTATINLKGLAGKGVVEICSLTGHDAAVTASTVNIINSGMEGENSIAASDVFTGTISAGITVDASNGTLVLGQITNNGTLVSGDGGKIVLASDHAGLATSGVVDVSGNRQEQANGFDVESISLFTEGSTNKEIGGTGKVWYNNQEYTVGEGGVVTLAADYTTYVVMTDGANRSSLNEAKAYAQGQGATLANVKIMDGGVLTITDNDNDPNNNSNGFISGNAVVEAGGKLVLSGHDALGWGNTATSTITLEGTAGKVATMEIGAVQTLETDINLNGNTLVSATKNSTSHIFHTFGGTVHVTGTNNTISAGIKDRNGLTLDLAANAALEISGKVEERGDSFGGTPSMRKTGTGKVTFSGANSSFSSTYTQTEGETFFSGANTTLGHGLAINGGRIVVDAGDNNTVNNTVAVTGVTGSGNLGVKSGTLKVSGLDTTGLLELGYKTTLDQQGTGTQVVELSGTGNRVRELDASMGGTANGTLRMKANSSLQVAGTTWLHKNASILLEEGAELTTNQNIKITGTAQQEEANTTSLKAQDGAADSYTAGNGGITITNAVVTSTKGTEQTLANLLENTTLVNAGSAVLKATNGGNTYKGIEASNGDILIQRGDAASVSLESLNIHAGRTVEVKVGDASGSLTVTQTAVFGSDATLNANLTLGSGCSLDLGGAVTLGDGNSLILGSGITLAGGLLSSIQGLAAGESYELFKVQGNVTLDGTEYGLAEGGVVMEDVDASTIFNGLEQGAYLLKFEALPQASRAAGGGVFYVEAVTPEPATSTLSLLALAALAARRRRK